MEAATCSETTSWESGGPLFGRGTEHREPSILQENISRDEWKRVEDRWIQTGPLRGVLIFKQ